MNLQEINDIMQQKRTFVTEPNLAEKLVKRGCGEELERVIEEASRKPPGYRKKEITNPKTQEKETIKLKVEGNEEQIRENTENLWYCKKCETEIKSRERPRECSCGSKDIVERYSEKSSEAHFDIEKFNRETEVFAPKKTLIFQKEINGHENDSFYFEIEYNLFKVNIGAGNKPKFIYCDKTDKIDPGENSVYISQMSEDKIKEILDDMKPNGAIKPLAEALGIDLKQKSLDDIENEILTRNQNSPLFFEKVLPIPKEELKKKADFYEFSIKSISNKAEIDENLLDIYASNIPEINPENIRPATFMNSANHNIILTNPGTGKTTTAAITTGESTIIDCSSANLLGFSTADTKVPGKLHNRTKPSVIEEIQEFTEDETLGKTLTYMEQGEAERAKGMGIKARGFSSIVFQGNPKVKPQDDPSLSEYLMVKQFRDFLTKISSNAKAFSRRLGDLEIGEDYKLVQGNGSDEEQLDQVKKILRTIAEGFKNEFTQLLKSKQVIAWINKGFENDHLDNLDKLAKECSDDLIKEFIEGQKLNYRHLRGGAIRRAWLKVGIKDILDHEKLTEETINKVIEEAEAFYESRKRRNIKSLSNILSLTQSQTYTEIIQNELSNIKPYYARLLIFSLFSYKNENNFDKIIHVNSLKPYFNRIKNAWNVKGKYEKFNKVVQHFEQQASQFKTLLGNLGIDFNKNDSTLTITDSETFAKKLDTFQKVIGSEESKSPESHKSPESPESHKSPKKPNSDNSSYEKIGSEGTKGTLGTRDLGLERVKVSEEKSPKSPKSPIPEASDLKDRKEASK